MKGRLLVVMMSLVVGTTASMAVGWRWSGWPVHASLGPALSSELLDATERALVRRFHRSETQVCFVLNAVYYTAAIRLVFGGAPFLGRTIRSRREGSAG
ncbi:MAG: hypothetical protein ACYS0G_02485 [Planctomycetota bacterium]|jgi:hypothetical protein